jgi:hypothetical protein
MAKALIGFDCAVKPENVGLILAEYVSGFAVVKECWGYEKGGLLPEGQILKWMSAYQEGIIAMDAPLGWPVDLGAQLDSHKAGKFIPTLSDTLFMRLTDRDMQSRFNKRPLSVGADKIARTALSAVQMLNQLRRKSNNSLPLAWCPSAKGWNVIEVYPAVTKLAHGVLKNGVGLIGLPINVECPQHIWKDGLIGHALDALFCIVAGADFLNDDAKPPEHWQMMQVYKEGWIWVKE